MTADRPHTAIAHPNIALIKYWGKSDEQNMIPYVPSLSMTLDVFPTTTTVRLVPAEGTDRVSLGGRPAEGETAKRVTVFLDLLRELAGRDEAAVVDTHNSVPTGAGLASSASVFAALAVAGADAYGLELDPIALSRLARRDSVSAARSIFGGFAICHAGTPDEAELGSFAEPVDLPGLDPAMVIVVLNASAKAVSGRAAMRRTTESPLWPYGRVARRGSTTRHRAGLPGDHRPSGTGRAPGDRAVSGTVRRHAPGKLFIAGEYGVIEPGHPAILVAVDRGVTVTVSAPRGAEVTIDSDLNPGGPAATTHVLAAVAVVDELLRISPVHITVTSDLHRDGSKFGLGSSGAVTVATVTALTAYAGLNLAPEDQFRLAMLATAQHDPRASGGDLAASVWGGWIAYRAPDRAAVLDLALRRGIQEALRAPWPGFGLRRLQAPRGLTLDVGWTGEPASTAALTGRLDAGDWPGSASHQDFLKRSDACVLAAIRSLDRGADRELIEAVHGARRMLAALDDEVRLGIFTPRLTALCEAAEAVGGAAKPSGAGGGDCGIALLDAAATTEIAQLRQHWAAAGIEPLPVHVERRSQR